MNRLKLQTWLQILVGIVAYLFVAYRIVDVGISTVLNSFLRAFTDQNVALTALVLVLMFAVWAIETQKWSIATSTFAKRTFLNNWRAVWYGLVVGQLTPNRIGEPFGRIAFIESEHRGKALAASVWCSFSQQLATLLFGAVGLVVWILDFSLNIEYIRSGVVFGFIVFWTVLLLFLMFKFRWILGLLQRLNFVKRMLKSENLEFTLSGVQAAKIVLLSVFKYLIFTTQYVILLRVCGVNANITSLYIAVMLNYLFITFIPSFAPTELGVRLGVAIGFIGMLSPNVGGAASAATLLWICNIALPVFFAAWIKVR